MRVRVRVRERIVVMEGVRFWSECWQSGVSMLGGWFDTIESSELSRI